MSLQYQTINRFLVEHNYAKEESLDISISSSNKRKINYPRQAIHEGIVKEEHMLKAFSHTLNLPIFNLNECIPSEELVANIKEKTARKHFIVPIFERSGRLFVATFDPLDTVAFEAIKYESKLSSVEPILASVSQIEQLIGLLYANKESIDDQFSDAFDIKETSNQKEELSKLLMGDETDEDEAPVVSYVSEMLLDAIRTGVSDLHFEPYETTYRVRFRRDGVLKEVSSPPSNIANRITARLKVMASMDIAEKRIPQDGRIQLPVSQGKTIDFRVNTLPTIWGEKIVLRILDSSAANLDIDILGFSKDQKALYLEALKKPQGLVLVTGPTGSGKTVSLYTGISIINQPTVNISTAEDPVEITLPGINQVNIIAKQGMTFASALRAFLRQDPDIIMVGEIRDLETAEISVKAAQTGHLVLSTLHTNDVPQTITRLANMGVPSYNIASSVQLIIAQRLARKLCEHCKVVDKDITPTQLKLLGFSEEESNTIKVYLPKGCNRCSHQGFKGRVGLYQVVKITPKLSEMIMQGSTSIELAEQCQKEGFLDLRQAALEKVKVGITSIPEILRVTNE